MTLEAPKGLTASRLRLILSIIMVLVIIAGTGIFYLAYSQLSKTAGETGEQAANAKQSQNTVERLQRLQSDLESHKDAANMTSQITADSQNYAYQDRLVNDLTIYASRANLKIRTISFTNQAAGTSTGTTGGAEATPTPSADGAMGGETPTITQAPSASLNKATVDITLESPVNYQNLLNFLHYVEQNLTKLKVSKVSLTKSDATDVTIDVLNLEVYLK